MPPRILTVPAYNFAEADTLAKVGRGTSKRWVSGYWYYNKNRERVFQRPITPGLPDQEGVSFLDLIEIVAIGKFLERGFTLGDVRQIVIDCQRTFGLERPLVTEKFETNSRQAFVRREGLMAVGRQPGRGSYAMSEILGPFLEELDYTEAWASRWWPLGRDQFVVIDPQHGFGLPVIAGSGVRTEIIRERTEAGDLPAIIAKDFRLTEEQVARAIQYELKRAA